MTEQNDKLLSKLSVRLKNPDTNNYIGTGLLYYNHNLKDKVYVFTAAHTLFEDGDTFKIPLPSICIDILSESSNSYIPISCVVNYSLVSVDKDKDVAILILDKKEVEKITGTLSNVLAIKERHSITSFILKGFPNATLGEELDSIEPVWKQRMTGVAKFQLTLKEDYTAWATTGFSGSGLFLNSNNQLYLFGIFTRYRSEDKGKVIYCQYLDAINEVLLKNFLSTIPFCFFGEHGLTPDFFKNQNQIAIKNLGPRFNSDLNFRLPIAKLFNVLAKDSVFRDRLNNILDKWLNENKNPKLESSLLVELENDIKVLHIKIQQWVYSLSWQADEKIEFEFIYQDIDELNRKLQEKAHEYYSLQSKEIKEESDKKKYEHFRPYENEISKLRKIERNNDNLIDGLGKIDINISNYPVLLIKGDAGSGKSHLLGDIVKQRDKHGKPTLLLLGQLFKNSTSVWQGIITQLNLNCTKNELLQSLNSIGKQVDSRVLILIDALNEGDGKTLWHDSLTGFISEFERYPFIGLAITVRTTYYEDVIPENIRNDQELKKVTHEGFKGNEYAALHLFCQHYGLEQPNFPILAPEYSNPLFLQLICQGVKDSDSKIFPQGFQGMSKIFGYYKSSMTKKIREKREEYRLLNNLFEDAIKAMTRACFEQKDSRILTLENAIKLFAIEFPSCPNLLADLIFENVIIQCITTDYKTDLRYDVVYFAYERFGDFFIAEELLNTYSNKTEVKTAFKKGNQLGKLFEDVSWRNRGILEALSVILPEKYSLEIFEVFSWAFKLNANNRVSNECEWLNHYFLDSLKWRTVESIDNKKITDWINSSKFNIHDDHVIFNRLIELTTIKKHPFNSDRLYHYLKKQTMPKRDGFFQLYMYYYSSDNDYGQAYPIKRLIDWAWLPEISNKIDTETARLTGQTLAWILSTTNRGLRDRTTKAMVNLLEEQSDALIDILKAFQNIDDMYILERLFGIAYGCALRTSTTESLKKIAQYVFDTAFKDANPPTHILLRDYARNTIEYASYKKVTIIGDMVLIKPPYNSTMPHININKDEIKKKYEIDHNLPNYKLDNSNMQNRITHSVLDWDFGRYTIDGGFHDFAPMDFKFSENYKTFKKTLSKDVKEIIRAYESNLEVFILAKSKTNYLTKDGVLHSILDSCLEMLNSYNDAIKETLSAEEFDFFSNKVITFLESKFKLKHQIRESFNAEPIKCWIVERVFSLGYDKEIHGEYDRRLDNYGSHKNDVERIGKKYQWIAFYEIFAMIADNFKVKENRWGMNPKYTFYEGAWQDYLRDIDISFTTKKNNEDIEEDEVNAEEKVSNWWIDNDYDYWNYQDNEWANNIENLPNPQYIIERKDDKGIDWVYLNLNVTWKAPKLIGEDEYRRNRKEIWYYFQAYIINKKDKSKIVAWLENQNFYGRWMPDSNQVGLSLFNRENYWSPASKDNKEEEWQNIDKTKFKVYVSTTNAVGEFSKDNSGAHFQYKMPCKLLFEGMKLEYAAKDGEFKNENGEIVVCNANPKGVLIRKNFLMKFLNEQYLDMVWVLLGEKITSSRTMDYLGHNHFKVVNGVYHFENEVLVGKKQLNDRD